MGFTIDEVTIKEMQKRKATFMFNFLTENLETLVDLAEDQLAKPLLRCKEIVESYNVTSADA
jgi:putative ATP-dependent endonuclease of the OLD family